jgi:cytidylate kinase
MIITIDGPAGAGKSSASRRLAQRLGFHFLDTGALYRAVTLAAIQKGIDLGDADALLQVANSAEIVLNDDCVILDGRDVTTTIRSFEITTSTRYAADHPGVRERLTKLQQSTAAGVDIVTEGRDQATVVFPKAECKIFLTASEGTRAQRHHQDLVARGEKITYEEVLEKQHARDHRDQTRLVGALRKANDAIQVVTDGMTPEAVVNLLEKIVHTHM